MAPVIWRSRGYYIRLLAIWASFGGCVYLYNRSQSWDPVRQVRQSFILRQIDKPKLGENELDLAVGKSPSAASTREDHSSSTTFDSFSVATFTYPPPLPRKIDDDDHENGANAGLFHDDVIKDDDIESDGDVTENDDDVMNEDDDIADYDDDDVTDGDTRDDSTANNNVPVAKVTERPQDKPAAWKPSPASDVNARIISVNSRFQDSVKSNPNVKPPVSVVESPSKALALPAQKGQTMTIPERQRKDIFTRDLSELSQEELIFRFVKNKEEFLGKSEKSLPMYLKPRNVHWTLQTAGEYSPTLYSPPAGELPLQRLPQAIIIGAGKCGTRAMLEFLSMHPLVVTPDPEIHFFDVEENFAKGYDWYKSQMPLTYSNQMTIEKTPSYIWSQHAVDEIYNMNKDIKLVAIVRNPVERIVSQASRGDNDDVERFFLTVVGGVPKVKAEARTVDWGIYVKFLKAWIQKYSASQIHILESKELIKDPAKEMQKIEKFLGLPPMITQANFYFNTTKGFYCMRPFHPKVIECLPEAKGKRHLALQPQHEKMLYEFYQPYNEELFTLLGRRFNWVPKGQPT